jgi:hypothetical protein
VRRPVLAAAFALALLGAGAVSADEPRPNEASAAATALFRAGRADAAANRWEEACAKFGESYALVAALGTLFNLAGCEERTGKLAAAWQHFQEVADRLPRDDARVPIARAHTAKLEPRVPKLTITIAPASPPGMRVVRDGLALGPASYGLPIPVDPGTHTIAVAASGHADRAITIEVGEGDVRTIEAAPGDRLPDATVRRPPAEGDRTTTWRTAGFVSLGVGAAATVAGAVLGALVLDAKATADRHCPEPARACDDDGRAAVNRGRLLGPATTVSLAIGVAGVATGIVLLLLLPRDGPRAAF